MKKTLPSVSELLTYDKVIDYAWRPVKIHGLNHLDVSVNGEFRLTGTDIPCYPEENADGYLEMEGELVHLVVALVWHGQPVVAHLDGDLRNNHYLNLAWTTITQKSREASKVTRDVVLRLHQEYYEENESQMYLAKKYKVSQPYISLVLSGKLRAKEHDAYLAGERPSQEDQVPLPVDSAPARA